MEVPSSPNLFVVRKSNVANYSQENPKNFVKPLVGSDVILLWFAKPGRRGLSMAHNVLDGVHHRGEHLYRYPCASHQIRLCGSWPNEACAIILKKFQPVGQEIRGDVGPRV